MSNSFRIEATELQGWHAALASRMDLRGVPAIAKEMEAHLMKKDADGTVAVTRHQLFTWAEALSGAAARDPRGSSAGAQLSVAQIVADMRGILTGKPSSGAQPAATGLGAAVPPPMAQATPAPITYQPAPPPAQVAPVTYLAPGSASASVGGRVHAGAELGTAIRDMIRTAQSEICVSSPWVTGIETLLPDLVAAAPHVKVLIVSRRPEKDDAPFHQAMDQLGRRKAVTAWSPHIQTRYVVVDGRSAVLGAASIPGPASREAGIVLQDAATIAALRAHFDRCHVEAAGGRY